MPKLSWMSQRVFEYVGHSVCLTFGQICFEFAGFSERASIVSCITQDHKPLFEGNLFLAFSLS